METETKPKGRPPGRKLGRRVQGYLDEDAARRFDAAVEARALTEAAAVREAVAEWLARQAE